MNQILAYSLGEQRLIAPLGAYIHQEVPMKKDRAEPNRITELRKRAEAKLKSEMKDIPDMSVKQLRNTISDPIVRNSAL